MSNIDCDKAFTECYKKYYIGVLRYIKKMVKDHDISEELTHDVFLKFYSNADVIEPEEERTRNYLFKIARYTAIDEWKRLKVEDTKYRKVCFDEVLLDDKFYENIEDVVVAGEIISTISDAVNLMDEGKKSIYLDRIVYGKSRVMVAREENVSAYRIKKIEKKIQETLIRLIKPE